MILPLRKDKELTESEIYACASKFQKLKLSEMTKNVKIDQNFNLKGKVLYFRIQTFFQIWRYGKINDTFSVTAADIRKVFMVQFIPLLIKNITRQSKRGVEDTSIMNKGSKSKHMQPKETQEDKEFLKMYQKDMKMQKVKALMVVK